MRRPPIIEGADFDRHRGSGIHDVNAMRPNLSPRRRRLFAAVVVLTCLAGQEIVFRSAFPLPEVAGFNRIRYQMMAGSHPNFQATQQRGLVYDRILFQSAPDGFSQVHDLNLYGFRNTDFAIEPPHDRRRIVLIGDSLTEGQGAPASGTIAAHWERMLANDGVNAEVLNLGVVAATLDHMALLARDAIPLLKPTDVVLFIFANDLPAPPFSPLLTGPSKPFPRRQTYWATPRVVELFTRVARGEPIYRRWPHPVMRFFAPVPDRSNPWTGASGPPPGLDPELYRAMAAGTLNPWLREQANALPGMLSHDFSRSGAPTLYLHNAAELCRAHRATLFVVYLPFYGVTSSRYRAALTRLGMSAETASALVTDPIYRRQNVLMSQVCSFLKIPFVDATQPLIDAEARGRPQFWSYDSHPRSEGYATIATAVHDAWLAMLPKTSGRGASPESSGIAVDTQSPSPGPRGD